MSVVKHFNHEYFNQLWAEAQGEFRKILADEKKIPEDGKDIPTGGDNGPFMQWLIDVYFQYMSAYKKFDHVYDQMVHPQKRPLVRQLLDLTLARLLEYREVMVGTELSDYLYYDDMIHYYKWLPEDIDLPIPRYYYHEPVPGLKERQELLNELVEAKETEGKATIEEIIEAEKEEWYKNRMKNWREDILGFDPNEMILALQTVERQRQGLYKFSIIQFGFDEEERERTRRKRAKLLQDVDKTKAAIIIQKLVRGFLARRHVAKLRERELIFLGIYPGPLQPNDERAIAQREYEEELQMVEEEKERRRKKGKGKKGKRGKKGKKKKKKKKGKDLTKGKTPESLFKELVKNGIIKKPPPTRFDDLIGFGSIINETLRKYHAENPSNPDPDSQERVPSSINPLPTFGDIKRALKDICVLPMGSETIHQIAPFTKSLLIAGPKGSGKKSLVYSICNELRATLFDLSPKNLVGKYAGKAGLKMLFHLLDKVGTWAQPVIILIDPAEMQYMKKIPKTEKSEPKRIKKQLTKFIKGLGPDDRYMVIGLSNEPWNAKMKPMKKDYQRFIYIPKPDHGSRLAMWRTCLKDHMHELNSKMNLELLTKLTDCWTLGSIKECVRRALKKFNKKVTAEKEEAEKPFEFEPSAYLEGGSLAFKPVKLGKTKLDMDNFLAELMYLDPIFVEQEKIWNKWYNKTPLQKARLKAQAGGGGGKKKGKKGKKGPKEKKDKKKKKKKEVARPQRVPLSPKDSVLGF